MKVLSVLVLCAIWSTVMCAVGEDTRPPLASYNYGITGEPSKTDTAFGNTGEVGPRYEVPSKNETGDEVPAMISSPIETNSEEGNILNVTASRGSEEPQVTNEGSSTIPPTQSFNTNATTQALRTTTEKPVVPTKTANESAPAAGDSETTTAIDMSTTQTGSPTEATTNATAIPGGQSVGPSQTFETGKPTRKPTAGPATIGNATKPGQQNGTAMVEPNSSVVLRPLTIIYCLSSVVLLISTTTY